MNPAIKWLKRSLLTACVAIAALPTTILAQQVKPTYHGFIHGLPHEASTYAPQIDGMFHLILWITLIVFVLVESCLVYFLVVYRHKPGRKATYYHGNNKLEITWTTIPAVILVVLAVLSNSLWSEIRYPSHFPKNAPVIRIQPRQFEWDITYPGPDGKFGTNDDIATINQLYLAVNQPVQIKLEAQDVIHSFFVPEFRIRQDAVPGLPTSVWINPDVIGNYEIACSQLCGLGHYRMKGYVHVVTRDSLQRWLASEAPQPPAAAAPATDSTTHKM